MHDLGSSRARWVVGGSLLLVGLTACGGATVSTVTITNTATVTASATSSPTAAGTSAGTRSSGSSTAATSSAGASSAPVTSPALEASMPPLGSPVPTSASEETILTVRLQAYDPATGTLTFVPQDVIETEGAATAVLSDPVGATQLTAQVTAQTSVKFAQYGTDIAAAIKANEVYCNMVLQGSQVSYLWELYAT
jgi:hypothetical protein